MGKTDSASVYLKKGVELLRPTAPKTLAGVGAEIQEPLHCSVHLSHHAGRPSLRRRNHRCCPQRQAYVSKKHALKDQKSGEVILAKASGRAERRKRNEKAPDNIRKAAAEGAGLNPG